MNRSVIIIGAGFAGLSAAAFLAKEGWNVRVIEKNETAGGRAKQLSEEGFTFDMGPSWYWMPDVFERFFQQFGKKVSDYYTLERLDPSYRVYWNSEHSDLPAKLPEVRKLFDAIEPESGAKLDRYLKEANVKYRVGMQQLVYKPGLSVAEFCNWDVLKNVLQLDLLTSIKSHVGKYFKNPKLKQLMEFPVLFLGALPENTPALYSLMNYADIIGGTWYPKGGMFEIVKAMYSLSKELGVGFQFSESVKSIDIENGYAKAVVTDKGIYNADAVISGADYYFTERYLIPEKYRSYNEAYWEKRVMAPSCLLYYIGLNKKLDNVLHHSLFFDVSFDQHADEIYKHPKWPVEPLFYLNVPSKTDDSVAPEGCENMMILVPVASGLENDTEELREHYLKKIIKRIENKLGESISDSIIFKKTFSIKDFKETYNSYKGNAYGLANVLRQTAILKPSCKSKKVKNLFYTGQLTVPGPGVPPSLISGEVVSKELIKMFNR